MRSERRQPLFYRYIPGNAAAWLPQHVHRLLDHPNINILLHTDYIDAVDEIGFKTLIYSDPINAYYDYCFGKLPAAP